jgi:folate-dependent phosphoribosylglycinamide formyltransferase PurN
MKKKVVLISSFDGLASLSCRNLFSEKKDYSIIGSVRINLPIKKKAQISIKAIKSKSFFYLSYIFLEQILPKLIFMFLRFNPSKSIKVLDIEKLCMQNRVPIYNTSNLNCQETIHYLKNLNPDLILSVRPVQILRSNLINSCPPIVNLHCSLLPNYRGIGGILQPLAAGESHLGCSVHQITSEEVDRGPIWAQTQVKAHSGKSVFFHTFLLFHQARSTIDKAINNFFAGENPLPNTNGSIFSWPDKSTYSQLRKNGRHMINFSDIFKLPKIM